MAPQQTRQTAPLPPTGNGTAASALHPPSGENGINYRTPYGSVSREALTGRRASEAQLTNQQHLDLQGPTLSPDSSSTAGPPKTTAAELSAGEYGIKSYVASTISNFASPLFGFGFKKARDLPPQKLQANTRTASRNEILDHPREIRDVKIDELKESDTLIALMGPTGSGKSSFISAIAGEDKGIGHSLTSHTSGVNAVRVRVPSEDADFILVDTPGFDDTHKSDYQILEIISDWLKKTGLKNIHLDAVLYLHRISDNRMAGTPLKNLEVFERICGPRWFNRVVLVTTMWDELGDESIGVTREQELRDSFWKPMVDRGSTTQRHENTTDSAWRILHQVLSISRQQQRPQLQKETVEKGKSLPSTDAGHELYTQMDELDKKRKALMRTLHQQMNKPGTDQEIVDLLQAQHKDLERAREESVGDLTTLKVAAPQRFLKSLGMKARYFMS